MHSIDRREFLALGAACGLGRAGTAAGEVTIGVQGYSFRDRSLEDAIAAARQLELDCFELYEGHLEPRNLSREQLRQWRRNVPEDRFGAIRRQFDGARIRLWSCSYNFRDDFTDEEIAHGFTMARALGVTRMNASANLGVVERIDALAQKAGVYVGLHNHSNIQPNELATPEDFRRALHGRSRFIVINLDIGHFTAAGFDPVEFLVAHHKRILTLHLKDRKKNQGPNMPFGEGDTPIREVLATLKRRRWRIPALIEYEYKGGDTVEEVRRARGYCRQALAR